MSYLKDNRIISTTYRRKNMKITSADFVKSSPRADLCPESSEPEFAFIGRSNVGKSSLINMLTERKNLAMTSSKPGKTMLINHFIINGKWYLVDLPGYGYASRGKRDRVKFAKLINHYVLDRMQMTLLFVLLDIRLEPQPIDLNFINMLGENGVPFALVFTKADKLSNEKQGKMVKSYLDTLKEQWEELPPYFVTSSASRQGRDDILNYIQDVITSKQSSPDQ